MLTVKNVIALLCIFALNLSEVTSWTIDLPVARKFYFERSQHKHADNNRIYFGRGSAVAPYDNIEGDSPHNTPHRHHERENYAHEYGYLSYMEKKVHGIFSKGSVYLEGLRAAVQRYSQQLQNCTSVDPSRPLSNRTWVPEPLVYQQTQQQQQYGQPQQDGAAPPASSCETMARNGEHVRRLAALVVWAVRELQDISYSKEYNKKAKSTESEEYVLLLQLAWALDELARRTGFQPGVEFTAEPTPAPAPTTTPNTYFNLPIPNDGPLMANCVKQPSPVPATVRCAVPVPAVVLQFLNMTNSSSPNAPPMQEIMRMINLFNSSGSGSAQQTLASLPLQQLRAQMAGCLVGSAPEAAPGAAPGTPTGPCGDFVTFLQFLNDNNQFQTVQPRQNREADTSPLEILEQAEQNAVKPLRAARQKRSADDPLKEFVLYFGKHKVWANSNPATDGGKIDSFDVKNHLIPVKELRKRSIGKDGVRILVPEDPMQDISSYAKHQSNVHYVKDVTQANEIKAYLDKLYRTDIETAKDHVRKLEGSIRSVHKRSVYYQKLHRPRVSEDPMQNISFYVKTKPGTNVRPDAANAALVRLGLQQIFERGNLVVVHRYGSNYVPGVQPLAVGGVQSTADI